MCGTRELRPEGALDVASSRLNYAGKFKEDVLCVGGVWSAQV